MAEFTWQDFYIETAGKLMEYRPREARRKLIDFLKQARDRGLRTINLNDVVSDDQEPATLDDIDPFTFFANFNRGITDENRKALCREIRSFLNVGAEVPNDFDGVPVVNNMQSWFFEYAKEREDWYIDALWDVAEEGVSGTVREETFDRAIRIPKVNRNLSIGLFWINPTAFLSVDSVMASYLGITPGNPFTYAEYRKALESFRAQHGQRPFAQVSHEAYQKQQKRYWVFNGNPTRWDVVSALRNEDVETWSVAQHADDIGIGDRFVLYVTGQKAGIYSLGSVTSDVDEQMPSGESEHYNVGHNDFHAKPRVSVKIDHNLVDTPILRDEIADDPKLQSAPFGTQGTNISIQEKAFRHIERIAKHRAKSGSSNIMVEESTSAHAVDPQRRSAKNLILYGPPGTGKTYSVVDRALHLVDGRDPARVQTAEDRDRYRQLQQGNSPQIEFVTFHQSFAYEDFVEGIRPRITEEESAELSYRLVPGVFRRIAERARRNYDNSKKSSDQLAVERTAEEVLRDFADHVAEQSLESTYRLNENVYVMEVEDEAFRYTGEAWSRHQNGIRMKFEDLIEMYRAKVNSRQDVRQLEGLSGLARQHATYFFLMYKKLKEHEAKNPVRATESVTEDRKEYVLIIDEINRGNVSQLLGELITLIEPDKRIDEAQETWVQLPYSQERFAVPPNLHIVGTMNTADRSLAALDTALRRRFDFEEMLPDASLLQETDDGIQLRPLLERVNGRIEALLDGDHVIGHAWLMDVHDIGALRGAFRHRIIPLLQEFFFDEVTALGKVLHSTYPEPILVALSEENLGWTGQAQATRYKVNYPVLSVPEFYKGIYEG